MSERQLITAIEDLSGNIISLKQSIDKLNFEILRSEVVPTMNRLEDIIQALVDKLPENKG